jgi:hypothetical protein
MFLNWVYEEITPVNLGFENIDWTIAPAGCLLAPQPSYADSRNPGQIRYQFMEDVMATLAAPRGW